MIAEIICVGSELLLGDVINTNTSVIAKTLSSLGIFSYHQSVVGDNETRLFEEIQTAIDRSDLIIISGGLGPTFDDITRETLAKVLNKKLVFDQKALDKMNDVFNHSHKVMTENNLRQAYVIEGANVLYNPNGTAPGMIVSVDNTDKKVILVPGVPHEMRAMLQDQIVPYLKPQSNSLLYSYSLYLFGVGESEVESILGQSIIENTNPTIAPYASGGNIQLRITASAENEEKALEIMKPTIETLERLFSHNIYSHNIASLETVLINLLKRENLTLSSFESITDGLFAQRMAQADEDKTNFDLGLFTKNEDQFKLENIKLSKRIKDLGLSDLGIAITGSLDRKSDHYGKMNIEIQFKDQEYSKSVSLARNHQYERLNIIFMACSHAMKFLMDIIKEGSSS